MKMTIPRKPEWDQVNQATALWTQLEQTSQMV